jgi:hypothetical protein
MGYVVDLLVPELVGQLDVRAPNRQAAGEQRTNQDRC